MKMSRKQAHGWHVSLKSLDQGCAAQLHLSPLPWGHKVPDHRGAINRHHGLLQFEQLFFCSLNSRSVTKCSIVDGVELSCYIRFSIYFGVKISFNLHIIPTDLDILIDIFCIRPFHVKCWSIVKPKKLKSVTRSIICSFKFSCGIRFSMLRCLWWKIINFVFLTFSDIFFLFLTIFAWFFFQFFVYTSG